MFDLLQGLTHGGNQTAALPEDSAKFFRSRGLAAESSGDCSAVSGKEILAGRFFVFDGHGRMADAPAAHFKGVDLKGEKIALSRFESDVGVDIMRQIKVTSTGAAQASKGPWRTPIPVSFWHLSPESMAHGDSDVLLVPEYRDGRPLHTFRLRVRHVRAERGPGAGGRLCRETGERPSPYF